MKLLSSVAALAATWASVAHAQEVEKDVYMPGGYLFELEDGKASSFLDAVKSRGKIHMQISQGIFKGVSVQFLDKDNAASSAADLAALPGVKNAWPMKVSEPANSKQQSNQTTFGVSASQLVPNKEKQPYAPHVMTQVDKLHTKGITGKGVKIAIIDTGVDYKHPALGGCFGKGCLVSGGYDFAGDDFDGSNEPRPDNDPMDTISYGTNVAGIIAAQPSRLLDFSGVAPGAELLAYKITGRSQSTRSDIMVAAMSRAYDDGANIILVSFTLNGGWREEPTAMAAARIVAKGVPVISAVGDYDFQGLFIPASPASGDGVAAVGSFVSNETPLFFHHASYTVDENADQSKPKSKPESKPSSKSSPNSNSNTSEPFTFQPDSSKDWPVTGGLSLPLYALSLDANITNDACKPLPEDTPDLSDYMVLIRLGGCLDSEKFKTVSQKGALNVLFYRDDQKLDTFQLLSQFEQYKVNFAGLLKAEAGEKFVALLKSGKQVTINLEETSKIKMHIENIKNTRHGGYMLSSALGPTVGMAVKPQFGAPGGGIISTGLESKYQILDYARTGRAAGYAAGVYALVSEARGLKKPEALEAALSSTAKAHPHRLYEVNYDFLAPVPNQGAGLIQAYDAAYAKATLSPASLSFNDTDHAISDATIKLTNNDKKAVTYKLSSVTTKTSYKFDDRYKDAGPPATTDEFVPVSIEPSEVTVQPGQTAMIRVRPAYKAISKPELLPLWSGWITVNGTDGSAMTVPYQGLAGSLYKNNMYGRFGRFYIKRSRRGNLPENGTITYPQTGDQAISIWHDCTLPTVKMYMELITADTRKVLGPISALPTPLMWVSGSVLPRWEDGKFANGTDVPEGRYKLVAHTLKVFGDEKNPKDWDSAESVNFNLKRG